MPDAPTPDEAAALNPMDLATALHLVELGAPMPDAVHREIERTLRAQLAANRDEYSRLAAERDALRADLAQARAREQASEERIDYGVRFSDGVVRLLGLATAEEARRYALDYEGSEPVSHTVTVTVTEWTPLGPATPQEGDNRG